MLSTPIPHRPMPLLMKSTAFGTVSFGHKPNSSLPASETKSFIACLSGIFLLIFGLPLGAIAGGNIYNSKAGKRDSFSVQETFAKNGSETKGALLGALPGAALFAYGLTKSAGSKIKS